MEGKPRYVPHRLHPDIANSLEQLTRTNVVTKKTTSGLLSRSSVIRVRFLITQ